MALAVGRWRGLGASRVPALDSRARTADRATGSGSESGYVLLTFGDGGERRGRPSLWYSTDGVLWSERRAPEGFTVRMACTSQRRRLGSSSTCRLTMADAPGGSPGRGVLAGRMDVVHGGARTGSSRPSSALRRRARIVAIERIDSGRMRAWVGTITGEEMTWSPDRGAGSAFDGAVVTAVVSDGTTPVAFGWERFTDHPLWWTRRGRFVAAAPGCPRTTTGSRGPRWADPRATCWWGPAHLPWPTIPRSGRSRAAVSGNVRRRR